MIDIHNLKIGNWFCGHDDKNFQFSLEDFVHISKGISIDEIIKEQIQVSVEWLLKLGFVKEEWNNGKTYGSFYTLNVDNWKFIYSTIEHRINYFVIQGDGCYDERGEFDILDRCKYVDQLQNFIYPFLL